MNKNALPCHTVRYITTSSNDNIYLTFTVHHPVLIFDCYSYSEKFSYFTISLLDTVSRAAEKKRQKDLFASIADV